MNSIHLRIDLAKLTTSGPNTLLYDTILWEWYSIHPSQLRRPKTPKVSDTSSSENHVRNICCRQQSTIMARLPCELNYSSFRWRKKLHPIANFKYGLIYKQKAKWLILHCAFYSQHANTHKSKTNKDLIWTILGSLMQIRRSNCLPKQPTC